MREYAIGIDVGGTNIKVGLFDQNMNAIKYLQTLTDTELEADQMMDHLADQVRRLLDQTHLTSENIRGVGAAFPSFIDYKSGVVVETSNIIALNDLPARDMLAERLDLPVYLDNDANAAALAEHAMGAGRGHDDLIYVTISTGIGGALILNGKLYRGMHGMAGEIGHMFISDSTGYPCSCGVTGCVQSISSGMHMARYATDRIKDGVESRILDHAGTLSNVDMGRRRPRARQRRFARARGRQPRRGVSGTHVPFAQHDLRHQCICLRRRRNEARQAVHRPHCRRIPPLFPHGSEVSRAVFARRARR